MEGLANIFPLKARELWEEAKKIPGYITRHEGLLLYALALNSSAWGDVVEIGPHHGRSSVMLGSAVKENGVNRLISIDDFSKQTSNTHPDHQDPKGSLLSNLKIFGLEACCTVLENDGFSAMNSMRNNSAGMVFIDGNHTEAAIKREFPEALRILATGGVVAIHDYLNPHQEQGYHDWIRANVVNKHPAVYFKESRPSFGGNGLLVVSPDES